MNAAAPTIDRMPIDRKVAREAAEWLMRLGDGNVSAADMAACEHWRTASHEHERAWQRAQHFAAQLGSVPSHIGMATLSRAGAARRDALKKTLVLLMTAAPATWLAGEITPWREWTAAERTATGERRQIALPDGSTLHLNTASAVDIDFDARERRLILRGGEILVDAVADATRAFYVQTTQGLLRTLGGRFTVREDDGGDRVAVFAGAIDIYPRNYPQTANRAHVLQAGAQIRFNRKSVAASETSAAHAADWSQGLLRADHMTLGDFLAEVSRYRRGLLRCDPDIAQLRLSGIYQLGDTDTILRALPDILPVRIRRNSNYWVVVEPA